MCRATALHILFNNHEYDLITAILYILLSKESGLNVPIRFCHVACCLTGNSL